MPASPCQKLLLDEMRGKWFSDGTYCKCYLGGAKIRGSG